MLKGELQDIRKALYLLKEDYDRIIKTDPNDRTKEQDNRLEYIEALTKKRQVDEI